jgi:hypothetical protein
MTHDNDKEDQEWVTWSKEANDFVRRVQEQRRPDDEAVTKVKGRDGTVRELELRG